MTGYTKKKCLDKYEDALMEKSQQECLDEYGNLMIKSIANCKNAYPDDLIEQSSCPVSTLETCKSQYNLVEEEEAAAVVSGLPVPCINRTDPVYICGDIAYADEQQAIQDCGTEVTTLPFIGDGIANSDPCGLPENSTMYSGCGFLYADEGQAQQQCGDISDSTYTFKGFVESFGRTKTKIPKVFWVVALIFVIYYLRRQSKSNLLYRSPGNVYR